MDGMTKPERVLAYILCVVLFVGFMIAPGIAETVIFG